MLIHFGKKEALCPILVCTKPEKLPNNVTRKVVIVSTHNAWGCYSHICHKWFSQGQYIRTWSIQFHAFCINTLTPNRNCKGITVAPDTNKGFNMIADVILKNGWYQSLNESGKKIQERSASSMGELMGFTDKFMVFYKNGWFQTFDETFHKISEKSDSSVGMFKNAVGTSMIFVKNGWAVTYDMHFKKISERHI